MRVLNHRDVATGDIAITENRTYSSTGTVSTWHTKDEVPDSPAPTCYVLALLSSCTQDQQAAVLNGTALVRNWIVIDNNTAALVDGFTSNGTSSGDHPSGTPSTGGPNNNGMNTDSGGAVAATSTGLKLEVKYYPVALVVAMAVAVILGLSDT